MLPSQILTEKLFELSDRQNELTKRNKTADILTNPDSKGTHSKVLLPYNYRTVCNPSDSGEAFYMVNVDCSGEASISNHAGSLDKFDQENFNNTEPEAVNDSREIENLDATVLASDQGITPADTVSEKRFPTENGSIDHEEAETDRSNMEDNDDEIEFGESSGLVVYNADDAGAELGEKLEPDDIPVSKLGENIGEASKLEEPFVNVTEDAEINLNVNEGNIDLEGISGEDEFDHDELRDNLVEDATVEFKANVAETPVELTFEHTSQAGPHSPNHESTAALEYNIERTSPETPMGPQSNMELKSETPVPDHANSPTQQDGLSSTRKLVLKNGLATQEQKMIIGNKDADIDEAMDRGNEEECVTSYVHKPESSTTSVAFRYRYRAASVNEMKTLRARHETDDRQLSVTPTKRSIYWRVGHSYSPGPTAESKSDKTRQEWTVQEEFKFSDSAAGIQLEQQSKMIGPVLRMEGSADAASDPAAPAIEGQENALAERRTTEAREPDQLKPSVATNMADLMLENTLLMHTSTGSELGLFVHGSQGNQMGMVDETREAASHGGDEDISQAEDPNTEIEQDANQLPAEGEVSESKEVTLPISTHDPNEPSVAELLGYRLTSEQSWEKSSPKTPIQSLATNSIKAEDDAEPGDMEIESTRNELEMNETNLQQVSQNEEAGVTPDNFTHVEITINLTSGAATTEARLTIQNPMLSKSEIVEGIPFMLNEVPDTKSPPPSMKEGQTTVVEQEIRKASIDELPAPIYGENETAASPVISDETQREQNEASKNPATGADTEKASELIAATPVDVCESDLQLEPDQALIKLLVTIERKIEGQPHNLVSYRTDIPLTVTNVQAHTETVSVKVPPVINIKMDANMHKAMEGSGIALDITAAGNPIFATRDISSMGPLETYIDVKTNHSVESEAPTARPASTVKSFTSFDRPELSFDVKTNHSVESETSLTIDRGTPGKVTDTDTVGKKNKEEAIKCDIEAPAQLDNSSKKPQPLLQFTQSISMKDNRNENNLLTVTITSSFLCPQMSHPVTNTNKPMSTSVAVNVPEQQPDGSRYSHGSDQGSNKPWTSAIRPSTLDYLLNPDQGSDGSDDEDFLSVASEPVGNADQNSDDSDGSIASAPSQSRVFLETLRTSILLMGQAGNRLSLQRTGGIKNRFRQSRRMSRSEMMSLEQMKFGRKPSRHMWRSVHKARKQKQVNKAKPAVEDKKEDAVDWERKLEKNSSAAEQFRIAWEEHIVAHYVKPKGSKEPEKCLATDKQDENCQEKSMEARQASGKRRHKLFEVTATVEVEYRTILSDGSSLNPSISLKPSVHGADTQDLPFRSSSSCASEQVLPSGVRLEFDETLIIKPEILVEKTEKMNEEQTAKNEENNQTSKNNQASAQSVRICLTIVWRVPDEETMVEFRDQTTHVCTEWEICQVSSLPNVDPQYSSRSITLALPSTTRRPTVITLQKIKRTTPPSPQSQRDLTPPSMCYCPSVYQPTMPLMITTPTFGLPGHFRPIGPSPTGYVPAYCGTSPTLIQVLESPGMCEQSDVILVPELSDCTTVPPATPIACPYSPSEVGTFIRMSPQWDTYQFEWSETEQRDAGDKRTQTPKIDKQEVYDDQVSCNECPQCENGQQSEQQCSLACKVQHHSAPPPGMDPPEYHKGILTPHPYMPYLSGPYSNPYHCHYMQKVNVSSRGSVGATYTFYGTPPLHGCGRYRIKTHIAPSGNARSSTTTPRNPDRGSETREFAQTPINGIRFEKRGTVQQEPPQTEPTYENPLQEQTAPTESEILTYD